jgi:large repetitive protein
MLIVMFCNIGVSQNIFTPNLSVNTGPNVSICYGSSYQITTNIVGGSPPFTCLWTTSTGQPAAGLSNDTILTPLASPLVTSTYLITVIDADNDTAQSTIVITVHPKPLAAFTFTPDSACAGTSISFTDLSTTTNGSISQRLWKFGDGITSNLANSTHTYTSSSGGGYVIYNCLLLVTNNYGCSDSLQKSVSVGRKPHADFNDYYNTPPFVHCTSAGSSQTDTLIIDNSSGTLSSIILYEINWGDGSIPFLSSTFPMNGLSHLYNTAGYFNITMTVTSNNGCTDTKTKAYFNGSNPAITAGNPGSTQGCTPSTFTFPLFYSDNNGNPNPPGTKYTISSNDGTPDSVFYHPAIGLPPPFYTHTFTSGSCGKTSLGGFPHSFHIRIVAENPCGISAATVEPINISKKPVSDFEISPNDTVCTSQLITLTNNSILGGYITTSGTIQCDTISPRNWVIKPSNGWNIVSGSLGSLNPNNNPITWGSNSLVIQFLIPGSYSITLYTKNPCGTDSITKPVCVNPNLLANFTTNAISGCIPFPIQTTSNIDDSTYCETPVIQWSVSSSGLVCGPLPGWNYTNGTNQYSKEPSFLFNTPGHYTITQTLSNSCGTDTAQVQILVKDKPQVTLNPLPPLCQPATIQPTALVVDCNGSPPLSYSWLFPGGSPTSSTLATPGSIFYAAAGIYNVSLTVTNSCGATSDSTPFVVTPQPADPIIYKNDPCIGGVLQLNTDTLPGGTYHWSGPNGFTSGLKNPVISNANLSHSGTYSLYVSVNGCPSNIVQVIVTVHPLPNIAIQGLSSICAGSSVTLTANGAQNYQWSANPSGSGLPTPSLGSQITFTPNAAGTVQVTVVGIDQYGCENNATVPLVVYPLPQVNAGPDDTLCNQLIPVQYSGIPAGGAWSGTGITSGGQFTPQGLGTFILTYTYTDNHGCIAADTKTILVMPPPVVYAGSDTAVCVNTPHLTFTGSPPGGTWSGAGIQPNGLVNPNTAGTLTFTYSYTLGSVTCHSQDQKILIVHPLPTVSITPTQQTICIGDTVQLTAFGANAYTWSASAQAGLLSTTGPTVTVAPQPPVSVQVTHTYAVVGIDLHGCESSATATVIVNPLPLVNAGPDTTVCDQPWAMQLTGTPAGGWWSGPPSVTLSGSYTPNGVGSDTLTYHYTNSSTSCYSKDSRVITVIAPTPVFALPDTAICHNTSSIQLSGAPSGGTWINSPLVSSGGQFTPSTPGTYHPVYTLGIGNCQTYDTIEVIVHPLPTVTISPAQQTICIGDTVQLTASGANAYTWSAPALAGLLSTTGPTVTVTPQPPVLAQVTHTYTVVGIDLHGCESSATATVIVNPLPVVNAGPDTTVCDQPWAMQLSGTPAGGSWSGSSTVTSSGSYTPNGVGSDTLTYHYTNGATSCYSQDTRVITVIAPTPVFALPDTAICHNTPPIQLSGVPSGGTWINTPLVSSAGQFTPSTPGSYHPVYTLGSGNCQTYDTVEVIVHPLPTVSITPAQQTICIGDTVQLTASGANAYTWSASALAGLLSTTGPTVTVTPQPPVSVQVTHTYTVVGIDLHGCESSATATVIVNPLPVVNAGPDTTVCDQPWAMQLSGTPAGGWWTGSSTVTSSGSYTPNGVGSDTLTYHYTNSNTSCYSKDTRVITVIAPTPVFALPDTAICHNTSPIQLSGVPSGGTWINTPLVSSAGQFTPSTPGTYHPVYTLGSGNCQTYDTIEVIVHPLPTVTISPAQQTICIGDTVQLTASGANGYTWSAPAQAGLLSTTGPTVTVAPQPPVLAQVTHTYTVVGIDLHGCENSATATVIVNPLPVVNAGPDTTVCDQPWAMQLSGTPAGGWWTGSSTVTSSGSYTPNGVGSDTLTYHYTNSNTSCYSKDSRVITVIAPTPVFALPDTAICHNTPPIQLSGVPSGGTWINTPLVSSAGQFTPSIPGTYHPIYTLGTGNCKTYDTIEVIVHPLPTITISPAQQTICIGDTVQLTGSGASIYTWSAPAQAGLLSTTGPTVTVIPQPPISVQMTHTYTVMGIDLHGCENSATATVIVNPLPVVNAGPDTTVCDQPWAMQLSGTPAGGWWTGSSTVTSSGSYTPNGVGSDTLTYHYTNSNTSCYSKDTRVITVIAPTPVFALPDTAICHNTSPIQLSGVPSGGTWINTPLVSSAGQFTPSTPGTYHPVYTLGSGNCQTYDTIEVIVHPLPTVTISPAQQTICIGDTVQLTASGANAYTWSAPALAGLLSTTGPTVTVTPQPPVLAQVTHTYTVVGIDLHGCESSATATVIVNPLPVVNAGPDTTVCDQPWAMQLSGTPAGGSWSGSSTVTSSGSYTPNGVGSDTLTYHYTNGATSCYSQDTRVITVIAPTPVFALPDTAICHNTPPIQLSGVPSGGTWINTPLVSSAGQFTPSTPGSYHPVYTLGSGNCQTYDTVEVIVHPLPTVSITPAQQTICIGDTVQLTASGANAYTWSASALAGLLSTTGPTVTVTPQPPVSVQVTHTYTVVGIDLHGCESSATATVIVNPLPIVNAGPDTTVCDQPWAMQFTVTPPGGTWSGPGVTTFGSYTPNGVGSDTLTYHYTNSNTSCYSKDSKVITVIAPTPVFALPDTAICHNTSSIQLSGAPSGGTWINTPLVSSGGQFTPFIPGTYHPVYTLGSGNCQTYDTIEIIVHPLPNVSIMPSTASICLNDTVQLNANGALNYNWSPNTFISSVNTPMVQVWPTVSTNYQVIGIDHNNCSNTAIVPITVQPLPIAALTHDTVVCIGDTVFFINQSTLGSSFVWEFGDNSAISTLFQPTHVYNSSGVFTIKLNVATIHGCKDSITSLIHIIEPPTSLFSVQPDTGCAPLEVSFINLSTGWYNNYYWDFGNGTQSTMQNPPNVFYQQFNNGLITYEISLTTSNICGTSTHKDSVVVRPRPVADFGMNVNWGCSPITVQFINLSQGLPQFFIWDFGDGSPPISTSSMVTPSQHTFYNNSSTNDTVYYVRLIAVNDCGTDTIIKSVTVYPNSVNAFFNTSPVIGCAPLGVQFTNHSSNHAFIYWDFGDGTTSTTWSPYHIYSNPGNYTIHLFVNDSCSYDTMFVNITVFPQPNVSILSADTVCERESINFTGLPGNLAGYTWSFGDGGGSSLPNPIHTYQTQGTYQVTLTGIDPLHGCPGTYSKPVLVLSTPSPQITPDTSLGCAPLTVQFHSGAGMHLWDFADGNTSTQQNPTHTFMNAGIYNVKHWLQNTFGCSDSSNHQIEVWPVPESDFSFTPDSSCIAPIQVVFTNQSLGGYGFLWDFGNGQSSTLNQNVSTIYPSAGNYTISLIAENIYGCRDTTQKTFYLYPTPVAYFTFQPDNGCQPLAVQFTNQSQNITNQLWEFGDGLTSTQSDPIHIYQNPGMYSVRLTAEGAGGCKDTLWLQDTLTVFPKPIASFNWYDPMIPQANAGFIQFDNTSILGGNSWWNFGDGSTSSLTNPQHRYSIYGTYTVQLIERNSYGCYDTIEAIISLEYYKGLFVSNAFSTDYGPSDVREFKPRGVGLKAYQILIYDTWGNLIWESDKLKNTEPAEGWDGRHKDTGQPLPHDVYVWKINAVFDDNTVWPGKLYPDGTRRNIGTVTLLR